MNKQLTEEEVQEMTRHMQTCSNAFIIIEMQSKTTNHDFVSIRQAKNYKSEKQSGLIGHAGQKNESIGVTSSSSSRYLPKKFPHRETRAQMFTAL